MLETTTPTSNGITAPKIALPLQLSASTEGFFPPAVLSVSNSGIGPGLSGVSTADNGVNGTSTNARGVQGFSINDTGVLGQTNATAYAPDLAGVKGIGNAAVAYGVMGITTLGIGVFGRANGDTGWGVYGLVNGSNGTAVRGDAGIGNSYAGFFLGRTYVSDRLGVGVQAPTYRLELPNLSSSNGQGRANAWVTYSSVRWKENIRPIDHALEKVEQLRGVYYDAKSNKKRSLGVIAEEVGQVLPEIVDYEENGTDAKGLDYARLTAVLIEAVKEQQSEIRSLKSEVERLNARFEGGGAPAAQ